MDVESWSDTGETFYLLDWLNGRPPDFAPLWGECEDFADFLVCLSRAVGARPLSAQRSSPMANWGTCWFTTKHIIAAPQQDPAAKRSWPWRYHQWTNATTIHDASLQFVDSSNNKTRAINMAGPAVGSAYYLSLVAALYGSGAWAPPAPFVPTIANRKP